MKILFIIFSVLTSATVFAQTTDKNPLDKADAFYDDGNCEAAIKEYKQAAQKKLTGEDRDKAVFRTAYCRLNMDNYEAAEAGFKDYLKRNPNDDTAKLKLSQALLYQGKQRAAIEEVSSVKDEETKAEAAAVMARAYVELDEPSEALQSLQGQSGFEATYWKGVAQYNLDQDDEAEKSFKMAEKTAPQDNWVKGESKTWQERIVSEKRRFSAQVSVGGFQDSNIAQSGSTMNFEGGGGGPGGGGGGGQGGGGPGGQGGVPGGGPGKAVSSSSNYVADSGSWAEIDLNYKILSKRKSYLTATLAASSPFYTNYPSYSSESVSLSLSGVHSPTKNTSYGAELKYLDTFYLYIYYQDYMTLTPFYSWQATDKFWMKASLPITAYLNNKNINLISPAVDLRYDLWSWLEITGGGSWTKSTAPNAVISAGPPVSLTSGTMFSHYTAVYGYLGLTFGLPWEVYLSGTVSRTQTNYELETLPGNGSSFTSPRVDILNSANISLNKSLIKNFWSISASYTYYDNTSSGFQGLISSGSLTNNTYSRTYTLLSTTFYF